MMLKIFFRSLFRSLFRNLFRSRYSAIIYRKFIGSLYHSHFFYSFWYHFSFATNVTEGRVSCVYFR